MIRLLDLFCGVGGCSAGYALAAAELGVELDVTGVDHVAQPEYPYRFVRGDAMSFPLDGFDVIHASPPCKLFTALQTVHKHRLRLFEPHDDLLTPTLERLREHGAPYVVENVVGAPMPLDSVLVCGSGLGLRVRRHRLFASSHRLYGTSCRHAEQGRPVGVYGDGGAWERTTPGGGGIKVSGPDAARALGISWSTTQRSLAQAIPPAYTHWLGLQLFPLLHCQRVYNEPADRKDMG